MPQHPTKAKGNVQASGGRNKSVGGVRLQKKIAMGRNVNSKNNEKKR